MGKGEVLFRSEEGRWLALKTQDGRGIAQVGGPKGEGEPFSFSPENLSYVANGIGYQAWGGGSHFVFRKDPEGVVIEFQSPHDRGAAIHRMSKEALKKEIDALDGFPVSDLPVSVL